MEGPIKPISKILTYPQSSCDCYDCEEKTYQQHFSGLPSNISVRNCEIPRYFTCHDTLMIDGNAKYLPTEKSTFDLINPHAYQEGYAKNFDSVECDPKCTGCPKKTYASWDPRLFSTTRGDYLLLDNPPLETKPKLKDIYDEKYKGYGQGYRTYSDITAGNVLYYTDRSRENPYYSPLFDQNSGATTGRTLYKDPMTNIKPHYPRTVNYPNPTSQGSCQTSSYCGLSWIRDSQVHREDLLASQMAKINQQRWEPRWAPINPKT